MNSELELLKKCTFVVGMHRSGTSATAGVLSIGGLTPGKNLMPAERSQNPKGFYENERIVIFNERLLTKIDRSWDHPGLIEEALFERLNYEKLKEQLVVILSEEFEGDNHIFIKDPRISLLLPFWKRVFVELGVSISFIISLRAPVEVSDSLGERDGFSLEKSYILWMNYMLNAEFYTRGCSRILINYNDILYTTIACIRKIDASLSLGLSIEDDSIKNAITSFIDPSLKHHDSKGKAAQRLPTLVEKVFYLFEKTSEKGDFDAASTKKLNKLRQDYFRHLNFFYPREVIDKISETPWRGKYFAQIFADCGEGFNESDSINIPINGLMDKLVFDLNAFDNIKGIRIDPINSQVLLTIESVTLTFLNGEKKQVVIFKSNAIEDDGTLYLFDTIDPNLFLEYEPSENTDNRPVGCEIILSFEAIKDEVFPHVVRFYRDKAIKGTELVKSQGQHIQMQTNEISSLKAKLDKAEEELKKQLSIFKEPVNERVEHNSNEGDDFELAISNLKKDFHKLATWYAELSEQGDGVEKLKHIENNSGGKGG